MISQITCAEARQKLEQLKKLELEFLESFAHAMNASKNSVEAKKYITQVRELKLNVNQKIDALKEDINPMEAWFHLKEQYASQVRMLEVAEILEEKEIKGKLMKGITDIEENFHPLPTEDEVFKRMMDKKDLLKIKKDQGFGKIRLIPFGMSMETLYDKFGYLLVRYAREEKLFTARKDSNNPKEPRMPLKINMFEPISHFSRYSAADKRGPGDIDLLYNPDHFGWSATSGQTKAEILKERKKKRKSGWDILVLENEVNLPRKEKPKSRGGRNRPTTGKSPQEYLQMLKTDPQYQGEVGLTIEETIIHALSELVEKNEVIDDVDANGRISICLGAYFFAGVLVPTFSFSQGMHQIRKYAEPAIKKLPTQGARFGIRL